MIARVVEVLHPEQVWLFGSRARGEARADSDWDFMAILANDTPEQDLDLASVWPRLRDLRLRRVEVFTMTRGEFDEWNRSLGTLAEMDDAWRAKLRRYRSSSDEPRCARKRRARPWRTLPPTAEVAARPGRPQASGRISATVIAMSGRATGRSTSPARSVRTSAYLSPSGDK